MKNIILFTVGISASGKTTWAENYIKANRGWVNINRDDIRFELFSDGVKDWSKYKFSRANEKKVTNEQERLIEKAAVNGKNIIISDTNLNPAYRNRIMSNPFLITYQEEERIFDVPFLEALKRDSKRPNGVGYEVISRQFKAYSALVWGSEYHEHTNSKKDAFICDIDGTIADMTGVRTPYEWDKVGQDNPRDEIIAMITGLIDQGSYPIFVSGRDGCCYEDTQEWISANVGLHRRNFLLLMREAGDCRKDTIIKKEIFKEFIDNEFNIEVVLDDRPSVSRMFQYELGLNVVNVGNPWVEF